MKLYIGNLPWALSDEELRGLFEPIGRVYSAVVVTDRQTGRSRGFGFVDIEPDKANQAIDKINGSECNGRILLVAEAMESNPGQRAW